MAVCIRKILSRIEQEDYLELLATANPSELLVRQDLSRGDLYVMEDGGQTISAAIVVPLNRTSCELRAIATMEKHKRKGYAKVLLHYLFAVYRDDYQSMVVGTVDGSQLALGFYESQGFRRINVIENYFLDTYSEPIFDNGMQCIDMVMLEKQLG